MFCRQLIDKTRADRILPLAVNAAVGGKRDIRTMPGAGQPDLGEAALLFEGREAVLLHRPLIRE